MASIIKPVPWWPGRNRIHPLTDPASAVALYPMWESRSGSITDVARGHIGTVARTAGAGPSWTQTKYGIAFDGRDTLGHDVFLGNFTFGQEWTWISLFFQEVQNTSGTRFLMWASQADSFSLETVRLSIREELSLPWLSYGGDFGGAGMTLTALPILNRLAACVMRSDGDNLQLDEPFTNNGATDTTTSTITHLGYAYLSRRHNAGAGVDNAKILWTGIWNRVLTDAEIELIVNDPFGMFERRVAVAILAPVAGGAALFRAVDSDVEVPEEALRFTGQAVAEVVEVPEEALGAMAFRRAVDSDVELPEETGRFTGQGVDEDEEIPEEALGAMAFRRAVDEDEEIGEEALSAMAFRREVSEDEEIPEAVGKFAGQAVADVEEVEEGVERVLGLVRAVDEDVETPEELGKFAGQGVDEDEEVPEEALSAMAFRRAAESDVEIGDEVERALAIFREVSEVEEVPEAVERALAIYRNVDATEEVSEELEHVPGLVRAIDEDVEISEEVARAAAAALSSHYRRGSSS